MVFSSVSFIFVFLPALLVLYFVLPARFRGARNMVLLGFSLFFYAYGGPKFLLLMLTSIAINYVFGLLVAAGSDQKRKLAAVGSVVCNLALLGWFKYACFLATSLAGLGLPVPIPQITLPIGISFFTFQGMSYVLDVYRKDTAPERNPLLVALYISLFPQLVAGPIVRYSTVADEIRTRRETVDDFTEGAVRFLFGLAKKMLLANALGQVADAAFSTPAAQLSTAMAWLGLAAYTVQIYFDFSGYSDMAIGLGRMFGFHFLENFNYPYISKSVTEFWRRWHISLSTWFRDYVYIPLGGNRCSKGRHIFNLLLVWSLTGFWHGAAWNFLCWGFYYAVLLIGERYLWGRFVEKLPGLLRHVYALMLVMLGWLLFRAGSLGQIFDFGKVLFGLGGTSLWDNQFLYFFLQYRWELLVALVAALPVKNILADLLAKHRGSVWADLGVLWGPRLLALALGFFSLVKLLSSTFNPFIYFRF